MKQTHTPGPWTDQDGFIFADSKRVADTTPHDEDEMTEKEWTANSSLIAAAPELLEALKAVYADWKAIADAEQLRDKNIDVIALAAIAKAEGR